VYVTVHRRPTPGEELSLDSIVGKGTLVFEKGKLFAACVTIDGLQPDSDYAYRLWTTPTYGQSVFLGGLSDADLHFRTLPERADEQIDFLLMSCHNPHEAGNDDYDGHAVWADIPEIISRENNGSLRFAILGGDQVYADEWKDRILQATTEETRVALYLTAYKSFWRNIHYRRVLCRLPAVLMWDDHDIVNSWGSDNSSFVGNTTEFKPEWKGMFAAASKAFTHMQAARNPATLSPGNGFDCCFKIGKWGFVLLDLRTNRNVRKKQIMDEAQAYRVKQWLDANKQDLHAVFVLSTVVTAVRLTGRPRAKKAGLTRVSRR
jgi:alkaline phosphatase D